MTQTARPIEILLVEDNPGDIRLTEEAFKEGRIKNQLHVVRNGEEALDYLFQRGAFVEAPRPDLVLLDLNLPRKSGLEVLEEIKADREIGRIPVVILTTSDQERDVRSSYDKHANCYITKPVNMEAFLEVTRSIEEFWLCVVTLPGEVS